MMCEKPNEPGEKSGWYGPDNNLCYSCHKIAYEEELPPVALDPLLRNEFPRDDKTQAALELKGRPVEANKENVGLGTASVVVNSPNPRGKGPVHL
jgi:hypothetical protein